MLTPLLDPDRLDHAGTERLIEHLIAGGCSALFILGTTGEGTSLSYRLRREVMDHVCRVVDGRVPVLVGVTDTAFEESVASAEHAATAGAAALVVAAPFLMSSEQAELRGYLGHLLERTSLPLFLYHFPPLTRTVFELETLKWAVDQDRIVGLKDSSGDFERFKWCCAELLSRRADWTLLTGSEAILVRAIAAGGHGGVCGGANLFPRLYCDLYQAAVTSHAGRLRTGEEFLKMMARDFYALETHPAAVIKLLKRGAAELGLCQDVMAEPFQATALRQADKASSVLNLLRTYARAEAPRVSVR